MQIQYSQIKLNNDFPFDLVDMYLQPHSNMDGWYHWHDCYEIAYIKSGTGTYYVENKAFPVKPGDIVIINDIEHHQLCVDDTIFNQINIVFRPSLILTGSKSGLDYDFISPFSNHDLGFNNKIASDHPYSAEIRGYIHIMTNEYREQCNGWQLMIKAKLLSLLTLLFRHFSTAQIHASERQNRLKLRKAFEYMENHYTSKISLEEVADSVFLTPQYFSTIFKKITHMNFIDYISEIRIQYAMKLLTTSCDTIAYIAHESGFHNIGHFNAVFKKKTGRTPTEFRNTL